METFIEQNRHLRITQHLIPLLHVFLAVVLNALEAILKPARSAKEYYLMLLLTYFAQMGERFLPYTLAQSKNSGSNLLMKVHH